MAVDAIAAYLKDAAGPVTLKKLQKDLRSQQGWSSEQATTFLTDAVQTGGVFAWPRYRNSARYWDRDPVAVVREQVLKIAGETALARKELVAHTVRSAHQCGTKTAQETVAALVKSGELQTARPLGPTALFYKTGHSRALIDGCLATLVQRLRKLGIDEPITLTAAATAPAIPETSGDHGILETISRLQPAPGVPVTIQSLRAALPNLSKKDVDTAVLSLADQQKLYLTTHDHGWALSETEREQLVWDGGQKLYVAVTLRD